MKLVKQVQNFTETETDSNFETEITLYYVYYDTQLYIFISRNNTSQLHDFEDCLLSLCSWFTHTGLYLNREKNDAVLSGNHQSAKSLSNTSNINVAGTSVALSDKVKLLGVTLGRHLTFDSHIL